MRPWHSDGALDGYRHTSDPDVIDVQVHNGGPRPKQIVVRLHANSATRIGAQRKVTVARREVLPGENVPVRVQEKRGRLYVGLLEADPKGPFGLSRNDLIRFLALPKAAPFMVAEDYFPERDSWVISPCARCGFSELLRPPHVIIREDIFPALSEGEQVEDFSWACICGHFVMVNRSSNAPLAPQTRPWWKLWG
jgi:hypothetical protein